MSWPSRLLLAAFAMTVLYLVWVGYQRHQGTLRMEQRVAESKRPAALPPEVDTGPGARILQFYARAGEVIEGERDLICYGVRNAQQLRLDPPVEKLEPALTQCFSVQPRRDTTYTLFAEGADGSHASQSFTIRVRRPPPSILFVTQSKNEIRAGEAVTVCYGVAHASAVRLDPLGLTLAPSPRNCTLLHPETTRTYALVATGEGGREDRQKLSIAVK